MKKKIYGVSIYVIHIQSHNVRVLTEESTLENMYFTEEAAIQYAQSVWMERASRLLNAHKTSPKEYQYTDAVDGKLMALRYKIVQYNLISD